MSQSKVKILSGWSLPGGSTTHHISLTNLLNDNGVDCTFYGPHEWHLDKCEGDLHPNFILDENDILISHFINIDKSAKCRKHILSCHETKLFPLSTLPLAGYDVIQFVSDSQKEWHGVEHPFVIIPPLVEKITWESPQNKVAGIIGSIDHNKQVHKSLERALDSGYKKVLIFGDITDLPYFDEFVSPFVDNGQAVLMGQEGDRNKMYGQISEIFHSSLSETYGLVEAECRLATIPFNGNSNGQDILSEEEILKKWKKVLSYQ